RASNRHERPTFSILTPPCEANYLVRSRVARCFRRSRRGTTRLTDSGPSVVLAVLIHNPVNGRDSFSIGVVDPHERLPLLGQRISTLSPPSHLPSSHPPLPCLARRLCARPKSGGGRVRLCDRFDAACRCAHGDHKARGA